MAALLLLEASNEAATVRGEAVEALTQVEGLATRIATPTSPHRASRGTETPEVAARAMGEVGTTITKSPMDVAAAATLPTKGDSRAPTAPRGPILVSTHRFMLILGEGVAPQFVIIM